MLKQALRKSSQPPSLAFGKQLAPANSTKGMARMRVMRFLADAITNWSTPVTRTTRRDRVDINAEEVTALKCGMPGMR